MWVRFCLCFYAHFLLLPCPLPHPSSLPLYWQFHGVLNGRQRCLLPRQRNKQKSSNVENAKTNTVGENTTKQTFRSAGSSTDKTLGCCKTRKKKKTEWKDNPVRRDEVAEVKSRGSPSWRGNIFVLTTSICFKNDLAVDFYWFNESGEREERAERRGDSSGGCTWRQAERSCLSATAKRVHKYL